MFEADVDDRRRWWNKSPPMPASAVFRRQGPSTYRRTMWRLSNTQALIFIAAVVVMVALAVWMEL